MSDAEFDGAEVLRWLKTVGRDVAIPVLVGCGLDNQIDDDLLVIEAIDQDNALQCRLGSILKRVPPAILARSNVIDPRAGQPLRAGLGSVMSQDDIELAYIKSTYRKLGLSQDIIADTSDARILIATVEDHNSGSLPSPTQQQARYNELKRVHLLALAAKVIRGWREISLRNGNVVNAGILIKLAYCLRHSGDTEAALEATQAAVRADPSVSLTKIQKCILATERAGALLDLFEANQNPELIAEARDCADMAWAISHSEKVRMVYLRIEKCERTAEQTEYNQC